MKIIPLLFILCCSLSIYSQQFSLKIDDELSIDRYQPDHDKQFVKRMIKDFYAIAYDVQLSLEQQKQYEKLDNLGVEFANQFDDFDVDLVLSHKGKVIGACCYEADLETQDTRLYMIMIDKAYRQKGYAEKFLLKVMDMHKFFGMKTMSVCAHPVTNSAGIKLYKKVGFEKIDLNSSHSSLEEFKKNL